MAEVKRQRLLTEAAGRVPSQDHTLERHLTLTPPTSGSAASRFMTEKSAFGVFGGASGRRNGGTRAAVATPGISCAAAQCVGSVAEGEMKAITMAQRACWCSSVGLQAAPRATSGVAAVRLARLAFPSIADVCLRGGLACGAWDVPEQRSIRSSDHAGRAEGSASPAAQTRARASTHMYSRSRAWQP
jgi:hypothetical protein